MSTQDSKKKKLLTSYHREIEVEKKTKETKLKLEAGILYFLTSIFGNSE